jgi:hypothetical protein
VQRLEENVGADNVELTREDIIEIDEILPVGSASGARYPDMSTVNR